MTRARRRVPQRAGFGAAIFLSLTSCLGGCGQAGPDDASSALPVADSGPDASDAATDATFAEGGAQDADASDAALDGGDPWAAFPTRYPTAATLSPISPFVAATLQSIAARDPSTDAHVFMKAGASGTVSKNLLYCFSGESDAFHEVDLDGRDVLQGTIDWYREGDAGGTTPFDRPTLCAEVGRSASWAISGDPSPLQQEIEAIHPRFAVVNYGTNDMQMGVSYRSALYPFYENFTALVDQLLEAGIVPLVSGLGPRGDSAEAALWVPTYNAVTRGIAEARQVPYLNMLFAYSDLPGMGLSSDGLHGNVYVEGGATQPCVFNALGLEHAYNTRNLATLTALDGMRAVVNELAPAPDSSVSPVAGSGTADDPYQIDVLPFTHAADTSRAEPGLFDTYPACDAGQDESGPEFVYRLQLATETAVRIALLDGAGVDVDLHLLGEQPSPQACFARADRMIERTLQAGTYHVVVDTFTSGGSAAAGAYLLVVMACEPGDADCA